MLASKMPDLVQGSDLLVTGVGGFGGAFSIADMLNIPIIQAYVFPITPTSAYAQPPHPDTTIWKVAQSLIIPCDAADVMAKYSYRRCRDAPSTRVAKGIILGTLSKTQYSACSDLIWIQQTYRTAPW